MGCTPSGDKMDSQRIDRTKWTRYLYNLPIETGKKVKSVSFNLKANDFTGAINVTDLQLQSGKQVTVQVPHTSEFLDEMRYNFDENVNIADTKDSSGRQALKRGVAPKNYVNVKNRVYNIVGRGHEVISLPNVFNQDYKQELLTSGLNLEIYAKDDFDWARISTNEGAYIEGRYLADYPQMKNHPLNMKYTREFYLDAGKAGEKITLSSTEMKATVGSKVYQFGQKAATTDSRQRLPVAPWGSFRLRIEFYKRVTENLKNEETGEYQEIEYVKDVGIGYYGVAQFNQIKAANSTF
jgi:hypothetical protein